MKHLLKKPQKRNNNYVSNFEKPLNKITLNDIKILNINKGLECHIPINNNEKSIEFIEEIDKISYETLKENPDYLIDENQYDKLDMIYNYSYLNDINNIVLSLNSKTRFINGEEEEDFNDLIKFLNDTNNYLNYNIHVDIAFLGLYINEEGIINRWIIKSIYIDELVDNLDWNKKEIEEEWKEELENFKISIEEKIELYKSSLIEAQKLYEEIESENNINIWNKKILKFKKYILKF
jgi:hypothetical protein